MEIEINDETGLPVLPDGQVWRVRRIDNPYTHDYAVEVIEHRERFKFLGPKVLYSRGFYAGEAIDYAEAKNITFEASIKAHIKHAAERIIELHQEALHIRQVHDKLQSFLGEYPPKSLNK